MLVGGQSESTLVSRGDLSKTSLELVTRVVLDTTVLNKHGEVPLAVVALGPAVVIEIRIEVVSSGRSKLLAPSLLDESLKLGETKSVDSVLQTLHIKYQYSPG